MSKYFQAYSSNSKIIPTVMQATLINRTRIDKSVETVSKIMFFLFRPMKVKTIYGIETKNKHPRHIPITIGLSLLLTINVSDDLDNLVNPFLA